MATPVKTVPQIPVVSIVINTDLFLVRSTNVVDPNQASWATMLTQALTAIPASMYNV